MLKVFRFDLYVYKKPPYIGAKLPSSWPFPSWPFPNEFGHWPRLIYSQKVLVIPKRRWLRPGMTKIVNRGVNKKGYEKVYPHRV